MIDFSPLKKRTRSIIDIANDLTVKDLRGLTNEMIDTILEIIEDCTDEDVVHVPEDPDAFDHAAATEEEVGLSWTLGHVIVHITASSEEAAFLAAEMARGVPSHGRRSRSEMPWQQVTTIKQCRHRLEESRRMRLASLDMWPDEPFMDNTYPLRRGGPPYVTKDQPEIDPVARFILGLLHDDDHLKQIKKIVRSAYLARSA